MTRGKVFSCEITASLGVRGKLLQKHGIDLWEIEEIVYDDPQAFSLVHGDSYFIFGRTFAGRYLLVLVRILSPEEIGALGDDPGIRRLRVITAREMNRKQKQMYEARRGGNR
jgi:uncharacterized DUF497 family protein